MVTKNINAHVLIKIISRTSMHLYSGNWWQNGERAKHKHP
jgi:hypothetical protein